MLATLTLVCLLLAPPLELLHETSFETGEGLPAGWTIAFGGPEQVVYPAPGRTGQRGVRLVDRDEQGGVGLRSERMPITPGTPVWATLWAKPLATSTASFYFEYWSAEGNRLNDQVKSLRVQLPAEDWTETKLQHLVPEGAAFWTGLLYSGSAATGDVLYDDVRLGSGFRPTHDRTLRPPAAVEHPAGPLRAAEIERAKANIAKHPWAAEQLEAYRRAAQFWLTLPADEIDFWLPELTPFRAVYCPRCDANWDYAWEVLGPDHLKCKKCGLELPSADYPENETIDLLAPTGKVIPHPCYVSPEGRRYYLSGLARQRRVAKLSGVGALGIVYALTGEPAYAERAVLVMRRLAEVYPDWVPHDWTRVYSDFSNTQSGKMTGWKLQDTTAMLEIAQCYDLIYDSGALSESDKSLIETRVFLELGEMLLPIPQRGCCINDGPFLMSAAAYLGVLLGDHRLVEWAIDPQVGFPGFLRAYFFRDGHWEDGSPSYEAMALSRLYLLPEILQGYSDPLSYRGADRYDNLDLMSDPLLKKIHVATAHVALPDRRSPAINDSVVTNRYATRFAEIQYHWYPTEQNLGLLNWALGGQAAESGSSYSLFRRDPELDFGQVQTWDPSAESMIRPGLGWAILRAGVAPERNDLILDYGEPCGGHGHPDRLNFLYHARGREVVSDFGYLGARHHFRPWMISPIAHNLVVVDGQQQERQAGRLLLFEPGDAVQAIVAEAPAVYASVSRFERALLRLRPAEGLEYLVDVFRVAGGEQHDYAFHGNGASFETDASMTAYAGELGPKAGGYGWLEEVRRGEVNGDLSGTWRLGEQDPEAAETGARLTLLGASGEVFVGRAPNLRDRATPYEKPMTSVLLQRRAGPANTFVAVIEAVDATVTPVRAKRLPLPEAGADTPVAVVVEHPAGQDLILATTAPKATVTVTFGGRSAVLQGRLGVISLDAAGQLTSLWLADGASLRYGEQAVGPATAYLGEITAVAGETGPVTVTPAPPADLTGRTLLAPAHVDGAYPIDRGEGDRIWFADEALVRLSPGDPITIPRAAAWQR